jgi:CspA family cold shock protein
MTGATMERGKVKFFNITKGFGFIVTDTNEDVFFHKSNVKNTGFRDVLSEGDLVEFDLKVEQKGKRAYNVSRV